MSKANLQIGQKYLHIRKTIIDGIEREAERWIKCVGITPDGAYFSRVLEVTEFLSDKIIKEELYESRKNT